MKSKLLIYNLNREGSDSDETLTSGARSTVRYSTFVLSTVYRDSKIISPITIEKIFSTLSAYH